MEGIGYIQLERRGLHHINSHVGHMMVACNNEADDEVPPELQGGSNDEDDWDSGITRITIMEMTTLKMAMMLFPRMTECDSTI